ncbi:hypothetical protein SASPL_133516 [Salvia splendens]|uniref:Uncharacterized protein n=1 Tax=Salvia splendens TaxID=180675 RepID=A0A8X8X3X9_SALSN|nr:hypothetical protein SASPL_133516 [Salvia splendens]
MRVQTALSLNKATGLIIRKRSRAKKSLKNLNLETSGSDKAETSHVQGTGAVTDLPDMSKGSKRMRESVMNRIDPAVDKNDVIQTEEVPKKAPGKKKVNKGKEKINDVIDMGFGELRNFGIAEVPGKMAYDLVKGFGEVDCTIQLENQRLAIYPEDGGEWFRKVFILIVDTVMINPCGDGKCRMHIDYVFIDISVVKEYIWCAYVLETLAVAVKNWRSTKNTPFTGPITFVVAFYVDRVFHKKLLVSRVFLTVFVWTSEKLRQREKMELESGDTIERGSLVDRGDPDKLPHPSTILVSEEEETEEKDQWEIAIEGFAEASEDAVRGLQNLLRSMNDVTNLIQNFEAMKIVGSTACNMIGVIPEVEVDEEETVASLKTALAKDKFNVPELVEAVQSMFKVTAQPIQLVEEGPPFDIHPSFLPKNEGAINVEEIVKSAMADYMEGGGDDAADEFYLEASGTKSITNLDNKLRRKDETNDKELDVEAIVKSAVEAYMECDEVDEDFVTPFANKSEPKLGKDLVVYANKQLHDNHKKLKMNVCSKAQMRCSNALRSPFLERAVTVSCKLTLEERVMYYWLMTTYHGNDTFCSVLNHMEALKSVTSPKRLFFTTYPALYTVVESNGKVDDADKLDEFDSNIDKEVSEIPHFKWGT